MACDPPSALGRAGRTPRRECSKPRNLGAGLARLLLPTRAGDRVEPRAFALSDVPSPFCCLVVPSLRRVSRSCPGWAQTRDLPASASQRLRLLNWLGAPNLRFREHGLRFGEGRRPERAPIEPKAASAHRQALPRTPGRPAAQPGRPWGCGLEPAGLTGCPSRSREASSDAAQAQDGRAHSGARRAGEPDAAIRGCEPA